MIEFTYKEDKNFRRRLRYLNKNLPHAADVGLLNWMTRTMATARSRAPKQTGALKASAYAYVSRAKGRMGFAARYARYAESMSSRPDFFMSSLHEERDKLAKDVKRQLNRVLKGKKPHENQSRDIARSRAEALAKARAKNPRA